MLIALSQVQAGAYPIITKLNRLSLSRQEASCKGGDAVCLPAMPGASRDLRQHSESRWTNIVADPELRKLTVYATVVLSLSRQEASFKGGVAICLPAMPGASRDPRQHSESRWTNIVADQ